jgi:GNAT superfamily N-acetyltransferase
VPTIRNCRSDDFGAVVALLRFQWPETAFGEVQLRGLFERALVSPRQRYLCAEVQGQVVGFGSLTIKTSLREGAVGYVDEMVVDPKHRCQGIATLLMQRLEDLAVASGCSHLHLDAAFHRKETHAFYEQRRFERRALLFSKELRETSRA